MGILCGPSYYRNTNVCVAVYINDIEGNISFAIKGVQWRSVICLWDVVIVSEQVLKWFVTQSVRI